jgi:hypothetical protein
MRRHHPTAADRARRARKRSTSPSHAHSHQRLKQQRTQPSSSTVNDENINTINTHTASLAEPHSPSPSSPVAVDCCECGHCPPASSPTSDSGAVQPLYCCWDIEPAARLSGDSAPLCQRRDITSTIRDGVSDRLRLLLQTYQGQQTSIVHRVQSTAEATDALWRSA